MNCELDNLGQGCCINTIVGGVKYIYLARVSDVDYLTYSLGKVDSFAAKPGNTIDWQKFEFNRNSVGVDQNVITDKFNLSYDITITGRLTGISPSQIKNLQSFWHTPSIAIIVTRSGAALTVGFREGLRLAQSNFETGLVAAEQFGWNLQLRGKTTHPVYICTDNVTNQLVDPCAPTTTPVSSCASEQVDMLQLINNLLDAELAYAVANGNKGLYAENLTYAQVLSALGVATPAIPNGWQVVRHAENEILDVKISEFHSMTQSRVSSGSYLLSDSPINQPRSIGVYANEWLSSDLIPTNPPIIAWVAVPVSTVCTDAYPITGAIAQMRYADPYTTNVFFRSFSTKIIAISPDSISPYPVIRVDFSTITDVTTNQAPTMTNDYIGDPFCQTFSTLQVNALSTPVFQKNIRVLTPYRTYNYRFEIYSVLSGAFVKLFTRDTVSPNPEQVDYVGIFLGQVITGTCTNIQDVRFVAFRCEISQIVFTC